MGEGYGCSNFQCSPNAIKFIYSCSSSTSRSAYTGRLLADLSHATRMNMGKSSVIV